MAEKINTSAGSTFNSTSLVKSSVVNLLSNSSTNDLKKGSKQKRAQKLPIIFKLVNNKKLGVEFFDASTCEAKLG